MPKNYYRTLGLTDNACIEEIRGAYQKNAELFHPDEEAGKGNGTNFLDIQEAFAVLSNPERRKAYDSMLRKMGGVSHRHSIKPQPLRGNEEGDKAGKAKKNYVDLGDISLSSSFESFSPSYDDIFERLDRNFNENRKPKAEIVESLNVEITLTPVQASRGGFAKLLIPVRGKCRICLGKGSVGTYECWHCSGKGQVKGENPVEVSFPPGVGDIYTVRVPLSGLGIHNFYLAVHFRMSQMEMW
ncbi:DnaJ domain-containing protein [Candidatus Riflebacteria bacterium]